MIAGLAIGARSNGCSGIGRASDYRAGNSRSRRSPLQAKAGRACHKDIAPPAGYLALCRGLIIDCGLGKLGQAFVGLLLFGQGLVEQLRGLRIVQLERPGLQGAVA